MDYGHYLSNVQFRLIQPTMPVVGFSRHMRHLRLSIMAEIMNTSLPEHQQHIKPHLQDLCRIPKMSTFAIGAIINEAVRSMPPGQTFVNIGVWHGFSFLSGLIGNPDKVCIGVDNFSEFGGPKEAFCQRFYKYRSDKHHFYEMDYAEYLTQHHNAPIGVYIYDGEHSYENQRCGLELAEPFFAENCLIIVDDTNYEQVRKANQDFIANSRYQYRCLFDQTTYNNYHPTFWNGITIFQRIPD